MLILDALHSLNLAGLLQPDQWPAIFGRAGGGGSSGGGGSGGGGGAELIALIGYFPTHLVASWFNKRVSAVAGTVAGIIVAVVVTVPFLIMWPLVGVLVGIGAIVGVYSGTHNWWSRIRKRIKRNKSKLKAASLRDGAWQESAITDRVQAVFMKFQADWTTFNVASIRTYTTPRYAEHIRLILMALQQLGRQNVVEAPQIKSVAVVDVDDEDNNDDDRFTAYVEASARDVLGSMRDQRALNIDDEPFEELWTFDRQGNDWLLDGIEQVTEDANRSSSYLKQFAAEHGMYYSLDWGRLLLPEEGQLFDAASFKYSDVNNHVIGEWEGILVQLYTYVPVKRNEQADDFLVGQITLPKHYTGILVRLRDTESWPVRAPDGYRKYTTEWPDFNKRYSLYATDADKFASFELLNPGFMAWLYDHELPLCIEVVDNVVYFYARLAVTGNNYAVMLEVLQRAFKELRR